MMDLQDILFSYSDDFEVYSTLSSKLVCKYILSCNATYSSLFIVFPP
jgi:hypothetical protein